MYKNQVVQTDKEVLGKVTESSNSHFIPVEWIIKEDSKFWPPLKKILDGRQPMSILLWW